MTWLYLSYGAQDPKVRGGSSGVGGAPITTGQRSSARWQESASHRRRASTRPACPARRGNANTVPCRPETPSFRVLFGRPAVTIGGEWFQAANDTTRPRPSGNTIEPGCGSGLSLVLTECSSPPGGRDARGRRVTAHTGGGRAGGTSARAPLSSELRHCTACPRPKSPAAEATWAQPLSREELS